MDINIKKAMSQSESEEDQRITINVWAADSDFNKKFGTELLTAMVGRLQDQNFIDQFAIGQGPGLATLRGLMELLRQEVNNEIWQDGAPVFGVEMTLEAIALSALSELYWRRHPQLPEAPPVIDGVETEKYGVVKLGDKVHVRNSLDGYTVTAIDPSRGFDVIECTTPDGMMATWASPMDVRPFGVDEIHNTLSFGGEPDGFGYEAVQDEPAFPDMPIEAGKKKLKLSDISASELADGLGLYANEEDDEEAEDERVDRPIEDSPQA